MPERTIERSECRPKGKAQHGLVNLAAGTTITTTKRH